MLDVITPENANEMLAYFVVGSLLIGAFGLVFKKQFAPLFYLTNLICGIGLLVAFSIFYRFF